MGVTHPQGPPPSSLFMFLTFLSLSHSTTSVGRLIFRFQLGGATATVLSLVTKLSPETHGGKHTLAKALTASQEAKSRAVAPTQGGSLYAPFPTHV